MKCFSLSHLEDHDVRRGLLAAVPVERSATAAVLAHVAEFDARQLYRDQSCSSMFVYCVRELGYSEDGARKRIHAARAAREFPLLFDAVADGRLHLCGVVLLAPRLTDENAEELVALAAGHSRAEIEYLLAAHSSKPGTTAGRVTESESSLEIQRAPGRVEAGDAAADGSPGTEGDLTTLLPAAAPAPAPARRDRITPLSADTYALEATLDQESYDLLRQIQALQGRGVPAHDIAGLLKRGLRLLAGEMLERKLGAGTGKARGSKDPYYISPAVKCAAWKRDGGRCTFEGENGKRCNETHDLEFDHIVPPSRGGDGSLSNVRLRCPAHNQREAEKLYGERFMREKREAAEAQRAAEAEARRQQCAAERAQRESERAAREAERRADAEHREAERVAREQARAQEREKREARRADREAARTAAHERRAAEAAARAKAEELVPALRSLGCNREQALAAAAHAAHIPDAPIEERVLAAVRSLGPRGSRKSRPEAA